MDDLIERHAIRAAKGNNGGDWSTHYNEDQKNYWRAFIRGILLDIATDRNLVALRDSILLPSNPPQ